MLGWFLKKLIGHAPAPKPLPLVVPPPLVWFVRWYRWHGQSHPGGAVGDWQAVAITGTHGKFWTEIVRQTDRHAAGYFRSAN